MMGTDVAEKHRSPECREQRSVIFAAPLLFFGNTKLGSDRCRHAFRPLLNASGPDK